MKKIQREGWKLCHGQEIIPDLKIMDSEWLFFYDVKLQIGHCCAWYDHAGVHEIVMSLLHDLKQFMPLCHES